MPKYTLAVIGDDGDVDSIEFTDELPREEVLAKILSELKEVSGWMVLGSTGINKASLHRSAKQWHLHEGWASDIEEDDGGTPMLPALSRTG